ncbi:MAG TPA: PAS domain S-box protein [Anaerolineae bacterium]|nr:PAS domain S-box protein [Anaerolineae bacterium]HQI84550.1 PAS domain S-box protein [Anaerolineae bacterium]
MVMQKTNAGRFTRRRATSGKLTIPLPSAIQLWKQQLANGIARASLAVSILALISGFYYAYSIQAVWLIPLYIILVALLGLVTLLPKASYTLRALGPLVLIYLMACLDMFEAGRTGSARVLLIALPVLSLLFFDLRAGVLTLGVSLLTLAVFGWLYTTGQLSVGLGVANSTNPTIWVSNTALFTLTTVLLMVSAHYLITRLINALSKLEVNVKENEKLLSLQQAVFDATVDGILAVDPTGKVTTYNRRFAEMWNIPEEIIASRSNIPILAFVREQVENPAAFMARVEELYAHPYAEGDDVLTLRDGRIFARHSTPQRLGDEIVGRVWVLRDVTAERQAAETLKQSQRNFDLFFNTLDDLLFVLDVQGNIIHVNQTVCRKLGYTEAELIGQPVLVVHPPERQAEAACIVAAMLTGEAEFCPVPVITKDGRQIPVETRVITGEWDGRPALFGVTRDISQLKLSEEALARERNLLRTVVDTLPDIIFAKDRNGRKILSNRNDQWMLGASAEAEVVGKTDWDVYSADLAARYTAEDQPVLDEGRMFESEGSFVDPLGQRHWVLGSKRPFRDHTGEIAGLVGIYHDITQLKQAAAEREALITDLEAKNAELERFTYTVSHDLKSPLITIKGFLGFLEQDTLKGRVEQVKHDIDMIANAADKMQQLLDELLELSRIGRLVNPPQTVSLTELAHEAAGLVAGQLTARGVQVDIAPNLPTVTGDRPRLREVLENLLSNAAKFMGDQPHPHIEVGVRYAETPPVVYVRDNGIGIAPQYHEKVFGLFEKLDAVSEGTGIGLAIVKRIVETHGGQIWVESEGAGRGSAFCFTLPQSNQA